MPVVNGKHYPYTKKGIKAAKKEERMTLRKPNVKRKSVSTMGHSSGWM